MEGVIVGGELSIQTSKDLGFGRARGEPLSSPTTQLPRGEALNHGNPWERMDASALSSKVTWKTLR